jgi:hypothetical protein
MKVKRKIGAGVCKKPFSSCVRKIKKQFKHIGEGVKNYSKVLKAARLSVKSLGGRRKIRIPRVIPVPKIGGILPLIPIFAGLSALGALSGGAAGVMNAVNSAKNAAAKLKESQRHNETMEAIALGKKGSGLYLKKYKQGLGLYLKKMPKNYQ